MSLLGFSSSNTNCLETSTALLFRGFYTAYYINSDMILCQPLASISWDFKELCFLIVCSVSQILQRGGHYLITWFSNRPLFSKSGKSDQFFPNHPSGLPTAFIYNLGLWPHLSTLECNNSNISVWAVGAPAIQVINEHVLCQGSSKMHHLA